MAQSRIERMTDEVRIKSYWKIALLTVAAAVAAVVISITSMTSGELSAGESVTPQVTTGDTPYFPGQYVNKPTGPSEHIQAF